MYINCPSSPTSNGVLLAGPMTGVFIGVLVAFQVFLALRTDTYATTTTT
jgi:hypothetical protein